MSNLDDLMTITVSIRFRAKVNPKTPNAPPVDVPMGFDYTVGADDAGADYLHQIGEAIAAGCLFGFMQQEIASAPVECGEWIGMTTEEILTEETAEETKVVGRIVVTDPHRGGDR